MILDQPVPRDLADRQDKRVQPVRLPEQAQPGPQDLPVQQAQRGQLDRTVALGLLDRVLMAEGSFRPPPLLSFRLASAGSVWSSMAPGEVEPFSTAMGEGAELAEPTRVPSCRSRRAKC